MKKTLKNIIICICIIYFILSLSSLLITKELIHEQWMTIVDVLKDNETEPVKSLYIELNKIIDTNLIIVGISALIGTIIGLVISKRESSVTRYIVYFIVGFVLYSFLWIGINYLINLSVGNGKYVEFIELYKEVLKPVIISYIMLYIVSIVVIIKYNKNRVKELNETLNNKIEKDEKAKRKINIKIIIKIVVGIIVLSICIFVAIVTRKMVILTKYNEKMSEINNSNNCYIKEEWGSGDSSETYYKDGITVYKTEDDISYRNINTKEWIQYDLINKTVLDTSKYATEEVWKSVEFQDKFITGNINYVGKLNLLISSFKVKIYTEELDGRECYVFETKDGYNKKYIDKETFLKEKNITYNSAHKENTVQYLTYEIGTVTDEDVAKPVFE